MVAAGGCGSHTKWQLGGGALAVTEPRDETRRGEGGVDPITVETIGNPVLLGIPNTHEETTTRTKHY